MVVLQRKFSELKGLQKDDTFGLYNGMHTDFVSFSDFLAINVGVESAEDLPREYKFCHRIATGLAL